MCLKKGCHWGQTWMYGDSDKNYNFFIYVLVLRQRTGTGNLNAKQHIVETLNFHFNIWSLKPQMGLWIYPFHDNGGFEYILWKWGFEYILWIYPFNANAVLNISLKPKMRLWIYPFNVNGVWKIWISCVLLPLSILKTISETKEI